MSSDNPDPPKLPPDAEWPDKPRKRRSRRTHDIFEKYYAQPSQGFPWRIAIYSTAIAYLFFDLYVLDGPLRQRIDASKLDSATVGKRADEFQWVALVNGRSIMESQLTRAIEAYNFKRGFNFAEFSPENLRLNRLAVLEELIEDELVRSHAENSITAVSDADLEADVEYFTRQFPTPAEFRHNLRAQKLAPNHLKKLIAAQLRQLAWIEENIAAGITVGDPEARAFFEEHRQELGVPEIARARHIFLSTVEEDTPERETLIRDLHTRLFTGDADFATLAREHSEDPRSAPVGGDLDFFSAHRMPKDFADRAFTAIPNTTPEPFRTDLGWHILEVTERKIAREATFEELQAEILSHLETKKRAIAITKLIRRLKKNSVIKLFPRAFESREEPLIDANERQSE